MLLVQSHICATCGTNKFLTCGHGSVVRVKLDADRDYKLVSIIGQPRSTLILQRWARYED